MSHKDKKNDTSFKIGNKLSEKWTYEDAVAMFEKIREEAVKGANSFQQAQHRAGLYASGLNYLLKKFPDLVSIKEDITDLIVDNINTKGLEGEYNATLCIWRMKQLGEHDKQVIEQTTKTIKVKTN